jgi:protein O-GlcNAc transferase
MYGQNTLAAKTQAKFNEAIALHQRGQLEAAKILYEGIIQLQPKHFDALHLLGVIAAQNNQHQIAVDLIAKAISINPRSVNFYINRGISLQALDQLDAALASYDKVISLQPNYALAFNNRGNVLHRLKKFDVAVSSYDQAIKIKLDYAEAYFNRGISLQALKQLDAAVASYDKAISLNPGHAEAYSNRGNALKEQGFLEAALASYEQAVRIKPDFAEAHFNCGNALRELKQLEAAISSYDKAISLKPDYARAYNNRGNTLQELKQFDAAIASYEGAIAAKADYAEAFLNRGVSLQGLGDVEAAIASYAVAIHIEPDYALAYVNRANALMTLKRIDDAVADFGRSIELEPERVEGYLGRGHALLERRQLEAAVACFEQSIILEPNNAEAHSSRGFARQELKQFESALASYDEAIRIQPDSSLLCAVYNDRGNVLRELRQPEAALTSYDNAIRIKTDRPDVYVNRGHVLADLKRLSEAEESYEKALGINKDYPYLSGTLLYTRMRICHWSNIRNDLEILKNGIDNYIKCTTPFTALGIFDSLDLHAKAAKIYVDDYDKSNLALGILPKNKKSKTIRIGYFSADFYMHATMALMESMFELHDKDRFEIFAFSYGPDTNDEVRKRIKKVFTKFIDVKEKNPIEIAEISRSLSIDIAVDLKGFTEGERFNIFSYRAAPIQVSYIGYPGTTGADYMDYVIADHTVIPEASQENYSEKIVRLPNTYQVNDRQRIISNAIFQRKDCNLPETGFIYCCFNNNFKITPDIFDCWALILKAVEGSALWLFEDNPIAAENLRKEAIARGLDSQRLVFAGRMNLPEHLARHRLADLFLDTLPYNAHTTASDALWAGLPVLTRTGESFASRVAASLLTAVDLPELITTKVEDYEALAIDLGRNPEKLEHLKKKLAANRLTTPLFDTELFTHHIEKAYVAMYDRYHADLAPDHINIE